MNKFIKFTIGAIVALLILSLVHGEPLVARQYGDDPAATPSTTDPGKSATTSSPEALKTTLLGKLPVPDAVPTDPIATADTTYGVPSGSGSPSVPVPAYSPTGTGSLIPQWASLTAKGGVPANPTGAPAATPPKPAETPNSAHKIEIGLINVAVIVGIVSYFY